MAMKLDLETAEMFINSGINGTNGRETSSHQLLMGIAIIILLKAKENG